MYIETSDQNPGEKARMISTMHPKTDGQCLMFFYHMYGDHVDTLNVYLKTVGGLGQQPEWTMSGNQGDTWYKGVIDIKTTVSFQVSHCFVTCNNVTVVGKLR